MTSAAVKATMKAAAKALKSPQPIPADLPIKLGVDLGTAFTVLVVTDVQSMTEGIDRALGPGRGRAWWGRILASADRAGWIVVEVYPAVPGLVPQAISRVPITIARVVVVAVARSSESVAVTVVPVITIVG